jgi:hypothetical protein
VRNWLSHLAFGERKLLYPIQALKSFKQDSITNGGIHKVKIDIQDM